jgi:hypothetical protein
MANRIQISEQGNGLLSRLDVAEEMFARSIYHEFCFCTSVVLATLADGISSLGIYEE